MPAELAGIFDAVGCDGAVCTIAADGRTVSHAADGPWVAASLIKILIAVEVERRIGSGDLDPTARVGLPRAPRTSGPVGFSFFSDPVELSVRDLMVPMLTLSDNVATDVLLQLIGLEACNATAAELGLKDTRLDCNLQTAIDQIGHAAGFASYDELIAWQGGDRSDDERQRVDAAAMQARSLDPDTASVTTARDMCRLLEQIWVDRAAPPPGCERIRRLMGRQLTRHRIASGFDRSVHVAAKSGGLAGRFRHEVGVVELPGNERYVVAVLTSARPGHFGEHAVNAAIGRAAATAVDALRR